ncbi:MAG: hypothetical protein AB1756_10320 [Acidobacteriota bacterium]
MEELSPDLARTTILIKERQVIGSHSMFRISPKTWLLHQLAVDQTISLYKKELPSKKIIQSTFQFLCLDHVTEYFVTIFLHDDPVRKIYFDSCKSHNNENDYHMIPCRWLVFDLKKQATYIRERFDPDRGIPDNSRQLSICGEADPHEMEIISRYLAARTNKLEYEAFSFGDLTMMGFSESWRMKGMNVNRRVFVARGEQNEMTNFAIVTDWPSGLNISGIMDNTFRIFSVSENEGNDTNAKLQLVHHVLRSMADEEKSTVSFICDENDFEDYASIPFHDFGKLWILVAHRNTFQTALQFFKNRYARLEARLVRQSESLSRQGAA